MTSKKDPGTSKVPYEVVEMKVEEMFAAGRGENEMLGDFLLRVENFIESCGWDLDEFESRRQYGELN